MAPKGTKSKKALRAYKKPKMNKAMPLMKLPKLYNFTRWATTTVGTGDKITLAIGSVYVGVALQFALSYLPGNAEFQALFDQYKINKVDLTFSLIQNPDNTQSSVQLTDPYYPRLWTCTDYDDNAPLSLTEIKERQKTRYAILKPNSFVKRTVYPAFAGLAYRSSTTEGYTPTRKFIDSDELDVPHFGMKVGVDFNGAIAQKNWDVIVSAKYHMSFKDPK